MDKRKLDVAIILIEVALSFLKGTKKLRTLFGKTGTSSIKPSNTET